MLAAVGVVAGVQVATGTFVVTTAAGQVVSIQLFAAVRPLIVHAATGTLLVFLGAQLVE